MNRPVRKRPEHLKYKPNKTPRVKTSSSETPSGDTKGNNEGGGVLGFLGIVFLIVVYSIGSFFFGSDKETNEQNKRQESKPQESKSSESKPSVSYQPKSDSQLLYEGILQKRQNNLSELNANIHRLHIELLKGQKRQDEIKEEIEIATHRKREAELIKLKKYEKVLHDAMFEGAKQLGAMEKEGRILELEIKKIKRDHNR